MATPLQYQIHAKENALYLCLEGDMDDNSFYTVSGALTQQALDQPVKVDLGGVGYINSAGLRALVLLQQQVKDAGLEFTLLEPSSVVKRVFQSTGLSGLFRIREADADNPC